MEDRTRPFGWVVQNPLFTTAVTNSEKVGFLFGDASLCFTSRCQIPSRKVRMRRYHVRILLRVRSSSGDPVLLPERTSSILSRLYRLYGTRKSGSSVWSRLQCLQRSRRRRRVSISPVVVRTFLVFRSYAVSLPPQIGQVRGSVPEITKIPSPFFS